MHSNGWMARRDLNTQRRVWTHLATGKGSAFRRSPGINVVMFIKCRPCLSCVLVLLVRTKYLSRMVACNPDVIKSKTQKSSTVNHCVQNVWEFWLQCAAALMDSKWTEGGQHDGGDQRSGVTRWSGTRRTLSTCSAVLKGRDKPVSLSNK